MKINTKSWKFGVFIMAIVGMMTIVGLTLWSNQMRKKEETGLTGSDRTDFIKASLAACHEHGSREAFCACYSNAVADSISVKQLKSLMAMGASAAQAELKPIEDAVTRRCLSKS
jgi:hypothetical protein